MEIVIDVIIVDVYEQSIWILLCSLARHRHAWSWDVLLSLMEAARLERCAKEEREQHLLDIANQKLQLQGFEEKLEMLEQLQQKEQVQGFCLSVD